MQKQDREGCDAVPRDTGRVASTLTPTRWPHALAHRDHHIGYTPMLYHFDLCNYTGIVYWYRWS